MFDRILGRRRSPLIRQAMQDVTDMLLRTERMFVEAARALFEHRESQFDVEREDEDINAGERLIRRQVLEHLALNPSEDLPASLVLVSIVNDVERLGDFSKGLLEARDLAKEPLRGPYADELRSIAEAITPLFGATREAFEQSDAKMAQEVSQRHQQLKRRTQHLVRGLAEREDATVNEAVVVTFTARILRRVSAHLSNVASTVTQPYDRIRHGDEDA